MLCLKYTSAATRNEWLASGDFVRQEFASSAGLSPASIGQCWVGDLPAVERVEVVMSLTVSHRPHPCTPQRAFCHIGLSTATEHASSTEWDAAVRVDRTDISRSTFQLQRMSEQ